MGGSDHPFLASATYGTSQGATLARDANTGEWVRADLVTTKLSLAASLSPDGRSILRLGFPSGIGATPEVQVVTLASGSVRTLPSPRHGAERVCTIDGAAWAPDSTHVGIVSGCDIDVPGQTPADPWVPGEFGTWVDEVDLASGTSRTIEVRADSSPGESCPSYSADGSGFAYGINNGVQPQWETGADTWPAVRAIALDGTTANEWAGMHVVHGDPWRDENTLLVWDEGAAAGSGDDHQLLDARSCASTSLGIPRLLNTQGFIAGGLLVDTTRWTDPPVPRSVALCLADVSSGQVSPWLTLPGVGQVVHGSAARSLLRPPSS